MAAKTCSHMYNSFAQKAKIRGSQRMMIRLFLFLALINQCCYKVSTWFANARRRLKKENKMTWEPKNKLDDEDVDVSDDDDRDHSFNRDDKSGERHAS